MEFVQRSGDVESLCFYSIITSFALLWLSVPSEVDNVKVFGYWSAGLKCPFPQNVSWQNKMFTSTLQIQQWLLFLWRKELKMYEDTSCCLNSPHMETPTHPKNQKETVQLHIFLLIKPFHPLISTLSSRDVKLFSQCQVTHMVCTGKTSVSQCTEI